MLPDFPKPKAEFERDTLRWVEHEARRDPLLSRIKWIREREGDRSSFATADGEEESSVYNETRASFRIADEELIAKGPSAFKEHVRRVAAQIRGGVRTQALSRIREAIRKGGRSVDAKGRPLTFELFLEMHEQLDIEFDTEGNPHLPNLFVVSPNLMSPDLKQKIAEWRARPEFAELVERKRREWNDQESNRKLVD